MRSSIKFPIVAAVLLAGSAFWASGPMVFAQGTDKGTDKGIGQAPELFFDRKQPPPGSTPQQQLDLDADGQLRRAPDLPKSDQAKSDKAGKKAEDAERERLALRALLRRRARRHIPDNAYERDKLLSVLYRHLAEAKDKSVANRIVAAIERVWLHSGNDTVSLMMRRAQKAEKRKKFDKALKYLGFVIKMAPDYAEGWNQRAYIFFKQKDYTRAVGDLRRVLALDPNHYKALEGLGQILRDIDEKRAALQIFRKLVKVYPMNDSARETEKKLSRDVLGQRS